MNSEDSGKKSRDDGTLESAEEKVIGKKNKQRILIAAAVVVMAVLALIIGISTYSKPENRLARALDLGRKYLAEENYEQAIVEFDKALELEPMSVEAYLGKAKAYVGMNDLETAVAVLEEGYGLTGSEEILGRLEELRGNSGDAEAAEMAEEESAVENAAKERRLGESGLPYFELGFSPEDFTIAGYSVMEGDHLADVEQAAAVVMPTITDGISAEVNDYIGWYTGGKQQEASEQTEITFYYRNKINQNEGLTWFVCSYEISDSLISLWIGTHKGEVPVNEIPLYGGKVLPNVTTYEETLDILGIREVVQALEEYENDKIYENGGILWIESQYGVGRCWKRQLDSGVYSYTISSSESEIPWMIDIGFYDNIVSYVEIDAGEGSW